MTTYSIRKNGQTYCSWTDPSCTPDPKTLRNMKAAGYRLYADGKPVKKSQRSV